MSIPKLTCVPLLTLLVACASPGPVRHTLRIETSPPGARLETACGQRGVTPCTVELGRFESVSGTLQLEDHRPERFRLSGSPRNTNPFRMLGQLVEAGLARFERVGDRVHFRLSRRVPPPTLPVEPTRLDD